MPDSATSCAPFLDFAVRDSPLCKLLRSAATHDVSIEFVKHKLQLFHRIDPDVDAERDFIAKDLADTGQFTRQDYLNRADPVFRAQTATGQTYHSDSRLLFLEVNGTVASVSGTMQISAGSQ
jgi:LssY C-terminus